MCFIWCLIDKAQLLISSEMSGEQLGKPTRQRRTPHATSFLPQNAPNSACQDQGRAGVVPIFTPISSPSPPLGSSHAPLAPAAFWSCLLGTGTVPRAASTPVCQTPTSPGAAGDAAAPSGGGEEPAGSMLPMPGTAGAGCHEPAAGSEPIVVREPSVT